MMRSIIVPIFTTMTLSACVQMSLQPSISHQEISHMTHTLTSQYSFDETVVRLTQAVQSKGMTVFATIDHQDAAKKVGLTMQPAKVIIFGTPKAGTPLMIKDPELALQLPLRVLVTEVGGKVQVVFNDTRTVIQGTKIEYSDVENNLANAEKLIRATVTN